MSVANEQVKPMIEAAVSNSRLAVTMYHENRNELVEAADLVLVASGTMALEVAFREKPMIVMYNASRIFYHLIGRWMIHTPYLSLPNILAGKEIVPEFMPYYNSTEPIANCALELLRSEPKRKAMSRDLAAIVEPMRTGHASQQTAEMLLDMIAKNKH